MPETWRKINADTTLLLNIVQDWFYQELIKADNFVWDTRKAPLKLWLSLQ